MDWIILLFAENVFLVGATYFLTRHFLKKKEIEFDDEVYKEISKARNILNDVLYKYNVKIGKDD